MIYTIISVLSLLLFYFFYRPYLKTKESRIKVIKLNLILLLLASLLYIAISILNESDEVESFSEGVKMLKNNEEILKKIGSFQSYSYYHNGLPNEKDDPASFKVSLEGSKAVIYLSCRIEKGRSVKWHLTEIKEDSLRVKTY